MLQINLILTLIIELIGGSEGPAKNLVFSALKNNKHVITANKALISKYGDQLAAIAEKTKLILILRRQFVEVFLL